MIGQRTLRSFAGNGLEEMFTVACSFWSSVNYARMKDCCLDLNSSEQGFLAEGRNKILDCVQRYTTVLSLISSSTMVIALSVVFMLHSICQLYVINVADNIT